MEKRGEIKRMLGNVAPNIGIAILGGYILLTGGAKDGKPIQRDPLAALEKTAKVKQKDARQATKLVNSIERVRGLNAETVSKLGGNALFRTGSEIQDTALAVSTKLNISPKDAKDLIVKDNVAEALSERNITFEPSSSVCLNPTQEFSPAGELEKANFPLEYSKSAAPDQPNTSIKYISEPGNFVKVVR